MQCVLRRSVPLRINVRVKPMVRLPRGVLEAETVVAGVATKANQPQRGHSDAEEFRRPTRTDGERGLVLQRDEDRERHL